MRTAAILLAAGEGRRIGGETFLERCSQLLLREEVFRLVVVLGHEADRVAATGGLPRGALRAVNPGYREGGMLSSILRGLDAAEAAGAEAVLVHPVDHPLVAPDTIGRVLEALARGGQLVAPSHDGRRGHPGGFARSVWPLLRNAPPEQGARAVLRSHAHAVVHVPGDLGSIEGIDTPDDYRRLVGEALSA
jgi:CTP:molybdopterin cytidylyltransferase MocA